MARFGSVVALAVGVATLGLGGCASSGGGGSVQSPGPSPPAPPPPPPSSLIIQQASVTRAVSADFNGYNLNLLRLNGVVTDPDLIEGLRSLSPGILRVPGGTPGEYWDWDRGGIIIEPLTGLPQAPPYSNSILGISGFTPEVVDTLLDQVDAPALFSANVLTADLSTNLDAIRAFRDFGQNIGRVELGNEEYFRTPNPSTRFPLASDYADLATSWTDQIKAQYPDIQVAAIAPSPLRNVGVSFSDWMSALDAQGWRSIDAVAIHPYFDVAAAAPARSPAGAAALIATMIREDDAYIQAVAARTPGSVDIWITEWNIFETRDRPFVGGTWVHGLSSLARALNFLDYESVDLSVFHAAVGEVQWQAIVGADGRAIDYVDGQPTIVITDPFNLTASGYAMSLLGTALADATSVTRLDLGFDEAETAIMGRRFNQAGGETLSIFLNGSVSVIQIDVQGRATILSADPWRAIFAPGQLTISTLDLGADGLTLPAFSVALVGDESPLSYSALSNTSSAGQSSIRDTFDDMSSEQALQAAAEDMIRYQDLVLGRGSPNGTRWTSADYGAVRSDAMFSFATFNAAGPVGLFLTGELSSARLYGALGAPRAPAASLDVEMQSLRLGAMGARSIAVNNMEVAAFAGFSGAVSLPNSADLEFGMNSVARVFTSDHIAARWEAGLASRFAPSPTVEITLIGALYTNSLSSRWVGEVGSIRADLSDQSEMIAAFGGGMSWRTPAGDVVVRLDHASAGADRFERARLEWRAVW